MSHEPPIARREVEILNRLGFHFRPAKRFVELALGFTSDIRVLCNGKESNGKSMLDLSMLAAECGTLLIVEARGVDAEAAAQTLAGLVTSRFFEDDEGNLLTDGGVAS